MFCFWMKNHLKTSKISKKSWKSFKRPKRCFDGLLGVCSTQKLVKIHNTLNSQGDKLWSDKKKCISFDVRSICRCRFWLKIRAAQGTVAPWSNSSCIRSGGSGFESRRHQLLLVVWCHMEFNTWSNINNYSWLVWCSCG